VTQATGCLCGESCPCGDDCECQSRG
jgi:hypothetical protein